MEFIKSYHFIKTYYKWFFYYITVIVIVIIALGLLVYNKTSVIIDEQMIELYGNKAEKDSLVIDNKIAQLKDLGSKYSSNPWAIKATGSNRDLRELFDVIKLQEISQEINYYKTIYDMIFDFSIIFPYSNNVMTNIGKDTIDEFFNKKYKFEKDDQSKIISKINTYNYFEVLPPMNTYHYQSKNKTIPIIQSIVFNTGIPRGTLFILVKENAIEKILKNTMIEKSETILLYNNGYSIGKSNNEKIKSSDFIAKLQKDHKQKQVIREAGYIYYSVPSSIAPWQYIYIYPQQMMLGKSNGSRVNIIIYSIMIFFIGLLLAAFFSAVSYKPLFKIFKSILKTYPDSQFGDKKQTEFEYIEHSMNLMSQEKSEIKKKLQLYEPVIKRNLLSQIIKGDFNSESEGRILLHEINLDSGNDSFFNVFAIQNRNKDNELVSEENLSNHYLESVSLISIIENVIKMYNLKGHVFETSNRRIAALVCFQNEVAPNAESMISKIISDIKASVRDNLFEEVYIGVGDIHQRVLGISKSFKKAEKMLDWIVFTNDDSESNIEKFLQSTNNYYFYPVEWEEKIINNLKKGDQKAVENIIKEIKYENYIKRNLRYNVFKRLFMEIIETEMKVIDELNLFSIIEESEYEKLMLYGKESDLWLYIEKVYCSICKCVKDLRENSNSDLNKKLVQFIQDNCHNPDISLKDLADRFDLSISKISVVFKDSVGCNFLDYINRKRIEKAMELLERSNEEIQVISGKVGFQCDKSFRRTFKKYQGISPIEYRMIKKGAS